MVSLLSDIAVGVSAIVIAIVAVYGLRTWRKELTGKVKFDIARSIMLLSIKLEANFQWVRHPFTSSSESIDRQRRENESDDETPILNEWYARSVRLQPLIDNLQKLQELGWEAEVVLDEESSNRVSEAITMLRECYATLKTAIEFYFEERRNEITTGERFTDQEYLRKVRQEIYPPRDDEISQKISAAKDQLVSTLKAYVK